MKEIFNSIRNKASQCSDKACFMPDYAEVITESRLKQIVDEAEAKWEAECCIWTKPSKEHGFIKNPHTGRIFSNEPSMQNVYCNTCGKPIKILEVE